MNATPRVRSGAFPQTPATVSRTNAAAAARRAPPTPSPTPSPPAPSSLMGSKRNPQQRSSLPVAPRGSPMARDTSDDDDLGPVIPLTMLDAPTQRIYVAGAWALLFAWRMYDYMKLVDDNAESLWNFLKWTVIDLGFMFGLPELRIPWLELSQPVVITLFFIHVVFDYVLMFNVPLPWQAWLVGVIKVFYDREISISERYVKSSNILHNASHIMGKQIINILPEGSAQLNPDATPFCIGGDNVVAMLPLYFNTTIPAKVELIRTDLTTNDEETIKLSRSQLRDIEKVTKRHTSEGSTGAVKWEYPVKKTGAYRLGSVMDEYQLEVRRQGPNTYVVPCPSAKVGPTTSANRCLGDLSDLSLLVEGTPPLKIVYSRTINGKDHSFHFQSLQPDGFSSPLVSSPRSSEIVHADEPNDVSWARPQQVKVGLNESMNNGGEWQYSIDEVHDAFGNVAKYGGGDEHDIRPKPKHLTQNFFVKERPKVRLQGCDLRNPLKVAKGKSTAFPVTYQIGGKVDDTAHVLEWQFSPIDTLTNSGDHGDAMELMSHKAKNGKDRPQISASGLYTLKSVSSGSCDGEVLEPASCLLLNPLEPSLSIRSKEITEKCAGNSIGLLVDLDFIGTPPFRVVFDTITNGVAKTEYIRVDSMRHQMELIPTMAGKHKHVFKAIDDAIYKAQPLEGPEMVLEQSVKPQAFAHMNPSDINACLDESVTVDFYLKGEAPFTLEYEIIFEGKRKTYKATDIQLQQYTVDTPPLNKGGEYTLALTSVADKSGCRVPLQQDIKISVRRQLPRAAFGVIESKRNVMVVEGAKVKLPVRLTGDGPWKVFYKHNDVEHDQVLRNGNDFLEVNNVGTYEITSVRDRQCGGSVESSASIFEVGWFPRPELNLVSTESISKRGEKHVKQDVCEGDIDGFDLELKGSPPFHVEYEVRSKPLQGSSFINQQALDVALGRATVSMDTAKAGTYTYKFATLSDNLYNNNKKSFSPIVLEQRVNAKPTATFAKPGQSFKLCKLEQSHEDKIPITLTGVPPFYLEIEVKHQSGAVPETYRIPSIPSHTYGLTIPRKYLSLGTQHLRIRTVRDARGCQSKADPSSAAVQVQMFDSPAIYPLESRVDYCVGERISYTLSGTPPFDVFYTFGGAERRATSKTTAFRRIAESEGTFAITGISDKASECRAAVDIAKIVHPIPSVQISGGRDARTDIHEGGEVDIQFDFWGTPPFEFTYTRSTNAKKGVKAQVLETRHDVSETHRKVVRASQEGTYEVVAIKDAYCAFSTQQGENEKNKRS